MVTIKKQNYTYNYSFLNKKSDDHFYLLFHLKFNSFKM